MISVLVPVLVVIMLWFFSTGAILWLNGRDPATHPASLLGLSILCGPAACAALVSAGEPNYFGAYLGFGAALIIWGWHEASFLMGFIAGPRRTPCPEGLRGWERFKAATQTVIYHEIALAVTALLLFAFTWGQPNLIAAQTFALLFGLRLISKLSIFLGVANINTDMMPRHLDYLKSYFRKAPMNGLFPLSLVASVALTVWFAMQSATPGYTLLAVLAAIGTIENCLLMLPISDAKLWGWFMPRLPALAVAGSPKTIKK